MDLMQSRAIRVILKILVVFFIGLMAWVVTMLGIFVVRPALVDTYALKFLVGGCYFPDYDNGTPIAPTSWQFQQEAETAVPVEEVKSYYEDVLNPRSKLFAYPNDDRIWQRGETGNGDETAYLFSCEIRHTNNTATGETGCVYVYQDSVTRIKGYWQFNPVDFASSDCDAWLFNQ
jgi:hypothetical protein